MDNEDLAQPGLSSILYIIFYIVVSIFNSFSASSDLTFANSLEPFDTLIVFLKEN